MEMHIKIVWIINMQHNLSRDGKDSIEWQSQCISLKIGFLKCIMHSRKLGGRSYYLPDAFLSVVSCILSFLQENTLLLFSCLVMSDLGPCCPCQAPLSMGYPRQEYQSGLLFPPP